MPVRRPENWFQRKARRTSDAGCAFVIVPPTLEKYLALPCLARTRLATPGLAKPRQAEGYWSAHVTFFTRNRP